MKAFTEPLLELAEFETIQKTKKQKAEACMLRQHFRFFVTKFSLWRVLGLDERSESTCIKTNTCLNDK